jgi:hypothetical protein
MPLYAHKIRIVYACQHGFFVSPNFSMEYSYKRCGFGALIAAHYIERWCCVDIKKRNWLYFGVEGEYETYDASVSSGNTS